MEYIILIVVLAVLIVGVGGATLLRPRGTRGVRRGRADRDLGTGSGTGTTTDSRTRPPGTGAETGAAAGGTTATLPSPAPSPAPSAPPKPALEKPPPSAGRMVRLRSRLARSQTGFGSALLGLLSRDRLDDETWDEIEDVLITADVGVTPARQIVSDLRTKVKVEGTRTPEEVREMLRAELLAQVETAASRALRTHRHEGRPAVILVVGVNGTGKTTTCGKLARSLIGDGESVVLGAADTFRAAAADQLQTWGDRVGAEVVRSEVEGADSASVAFEAVSKGIEAEVDVVVIDTAGRLHTKAGLMDELGKVKRVVEKRTAVDEVLLVLDATTGQNGLRQARVFAEVVDVSGIVLTKLDGTAKGGIVIAVQRELGVPVKLVGLGEGPDDLAPFEPATFVDAILGG
ncbi:signal recognition particle-docking protein FtsY [Trebonia sp.]|uniref:signal recognition particle-docking protein FtsY n=1 Tax=Trebonia sp. TaxID=2767075 RepID=UPI00260F87D8|nr:signal recognition particle-docking protein FtsY [Trebonia sp.]